LVKLPGYLGFPPEPQELRARKIGHVIVNTATDRPWAQYFCCLLAANREFVRKNPVATKRAPRAIVKATNICALDPARVARFLVDKNFTNNYDYALGTLTFTVWPVARVRRGRHKSFLRAPSPRGGDDQVEPSEDHRPRHRLAIPQ
jgi:hypothetical protein